MEEFQGRIGRLAEDSTPWFADYPSAPDGAPNVVLVMLDDIGFGQLGCFGSRVRTPNIDRLAGNGAVYSNFHTNAICAPSRASLMTGRNSHSVGFGSLPHFEVGYPGYNSRLPRDCATMPRVLREHGYSTWALGKWHLTPAHDCGPAGPFDRWPLGAGFDRFYGFLGAVTDQYLPDLVSDNGRVDPPSTPQQGYHLTEDLVDKAIDLVGTHHASAPDRPFFMYLSPGAGHSPHQVPAEWADAYRGEFDDGWDVVRDETLAAQKELGLIAPDVELPDSNPGVSAWEELDPRHRRVNARMMEVFAGFLTHFDHHLGRLLDFLETTGKLENTLVMVTSDNGASAEGGPDGEFNEWCYINGRSQETEAFEERLDELGGPASYGNYPWGWSQAGNTPFRWYKHFTHNGGTSVPMVAHWPRGLEKGGGVRRQYHHMIDIMPTVLDAVGVEPPTTLDGVQQRELAGISLAYTFQDPPATGRRTTQYFETLGNRAIYHDGWVAVARHVMYPPGNPGGSGPSRHPDEIPWELYDLASDPTQINDLAAEFPERVSELVALWWAEAERYGVLPLDSRPVLARLQDSASAPLVPGLAHDHFEFFGDVRSVPMAPGPEMAGRSFSVTVDAVPDTADPSGVLFSFGLAHGGCSFYCLDGQLVFEFNFGGTHRRVQGELSAGHGPRTYRFTYRHSGARDGRALLESDGELVSDERVEGFPEGLMAVGGPVVRVGRDAPVPVSNQYADSFPFNGRVSRVAVDMSPRGTDLSASAHSALVTD